MIRRFRFPECTMLSLIVALTLMTSPSAAQNAELPLPPQAPPPGNGLPDFNGVWQAPYVPDLTRVLRTDPPFTPLGAETFRATWGTDNPTGYCQPTGATPVVHSPFPFQIIQTSGMLTVLYEIHTTFRRIFTDGRTFPEDLDQTWWGYSIGKYQGNTLRVETRSVNDKTWLDTAGHQHSDKLRITRDLREDRT